MKNNLHDLTEFEPVCIVTPIRQQTLYYYFKYTHIEYRMCSVDFNQWLLPYRYHVD